MKKLTATIAALGLTLGAFAQGTVNMDNSTLAVVGLSIDGQQNYYSGPVTFEFYAENALLSGAQINSINALWATPVAALNAVQAAGLVLDSGLVVGQASGGVFTLDASVLISGITHGATVGMGLICWNNITDTSLAAALTRPGVEIGVISFNNATGDPTASPAGTPALLTGWDATGQDLVMAPVPEPTSFALAGLGAAAMMIFRRRKS